MNEYSRRHVMLALPSLGLASLGAAAVVSRRVYAQPTGLGKLLSSASQKGGDQEARWWLNVGTCRPDAKGEVPVETPQDERTDCGAQGRSCA